MKKTFVFDKIEDELLDIDESTIIAETGIDAERVKEAVMKEITGKRKGKILPFKKIFTIIAAAAVIAAASLTAMAATGGLHPAFAELFAGEPANGIFPGAELSVNSDDLNIEFIGVAGDERSMLSLFDITKKDGSSFVDTVDDYCFIGNHADMEVTESDFKKLVQSLPGGHGMSYGVTYYFVDEKTIRAAASLSDSDGCIKGETLTVWDYETTFFHIDDILYSDETDTFMGCFDYKHEHEEELDALKATFGENTAIMPVILDGHANLVVTTATTVPFDYHLSVKLNYKTVEKNFIKAIGTEFNALNSDWKVNSLKASCFGIKLKASTDNYGLYDGFDMENSANWSAETNHDFMNVSKDITLEITLNDGTKLLADSYDSSSSADGSSAKSEWDCAYRIDSDQIITYAIDPGEIASITCNGTELYGNN